MRRNFTLDGFRTRRAALLNAGEAGFPVTLDAVLFRLYSGQ